MANPDDSGMRHSILIKVEGLSDKEFESIAELVKAIDTKCRKHLGDKYELIESPTLEHLPAWTLPHMQAKVKTYPKCPECGAHDGYDESVGACWKCGA